MDSLEVTVIIITSKSVDLKFNENLFDLRLDSFSDFSKESAYRNLVIAFHDAECRKWKKIKLWLARQRGFPRTRGEFSICGYISPSTYSAQCHSSGLNNPSSFGLILIQRSAMIYSRRTLLVLVIVCVMVSVALSRIPDKIGVCIRNCAQCRQMYGVYFDGQKCADFCIKYKGKFVPDAVDADTLTPFLIIPEADM